MASAVSGRLGGERDWFDEQLDAFKWRNAERAKPDYQLEYESVLSPEIRNARSRFLDTMAEHQQNRAPRTSEQ